jgi:hypothetical protein
MIKKLINQPYAPKWEIEEKEIYNQQYMVQFFSEACQRL